MITKLAITMKNEKLKKGIGSRAVMRSCGHAVVQYCCLEKFPRLHDCMTARLHDFFDRTTA